MNHKNMQRTIVTTLKPPAMLIATLMISFSAAADPVTLDADSAKSIRDLMGGMIGDDHPGYAVGVVVDDQVVFSHYAGLALLDTPTPIDEHTRFNIASVAKQYTALMILELARSGRLDTTQDFRTYLPDAMPEIEPQISVNQLLTHTSGIRDVYDLFFLTNATWYETDFSNDTARQLLDSQVALNFLPGSAYQYSNSNYILLAEIVEEITGEPFHDYATSFLDARGLKKSNVRRRQGQVIPRLARAYADWGSGWLEFPDIASTQGDGFLFSTLPDQLRWETQVWGHDQTLPDELIAESQSPLSDDPIDEYGYGLEFGFYRGLPITYHEGATGGYNAYTMRIPSLKTSIVTLGNTGQVNAVSLARNVADQFLADYFDDGAGYATGPMTTDSSLQIGDFLGLYELEDGTFIELTQRDGKVYREIEWYEPTQLIQERDNVFRYETDETLKIALSQDDDGIRQFTLYSPSVAPRIARSIPPSPDSEAYKKSLEGDFFNAETNTEIKLRFAGENAFTMIKNDRPRTLKIVGEDYLVWSSYRITVLRDDSNRAMGLSVDRGRIRNVKFYRTDSY